MDLAGPATRHIIFLLVPRPTPQDPASQFRAQVVRQQLAFSLRNMILSSFVIPIISIVSSLPLIGAWNVPSGLVNTATKTCSRREVLKSVWTVTVGTTAAVATLGPESAWAGGNSGDTNGGLCRPSSKKLVRQIYDIIDISVQASSVQAWPSAAESIHDPLLDEMRLSSVLIEACSPSSDKNQAVINDILDGVLSMRYKLNGVNKLATEDAVAVMSLGTTARSNLDLLFEL